MEVGKVLVIADNVTFYDFWEQSISQDWHDEEDEHQKEEHIEEWVDRHNDCLE